MSLEGIDWELQEAEDNAALQQLLDQQNNPQDDNGLDLSRPLEVGEKADDAEDFEDISDDDLPEEEDANGAPLPDDEEIPDDFGASNDTDDLFGDDMRGSSPFDEGGNTGGLPIPNNSDTSPSTGGSFLAMPSSKPTPTDFKAINFDPEPKPADEANQDLSIPAPAENQAELVKQVWPGFEKGVTINWNELLPPKKAHYIPKQPLKPPKQINPTKVSLDLSKDEEKGFRTAAQAQPTEEQRIQSALASHAVPIIEEESDEATAEEDLDWGLPTPEDRVGGVSWADLQLICDDWEARIDAASAPVAEERIEPEATYDDVEDDWFKEMGVHPAKRQKITHSHDDIDILNAPSFEVPSFDDFERITAKVAKRVVLDLNDPYLLIDIQQPNPDDRRLMRLGGNFRRGGTGNLSKSLSQRFNISNDEAYDALKENHQNKVRALIGNITVEHSMPALKLQWPYYKVKLSIKDARTYHRPSLKFTKFVNHVIYFSKPAQRKRKHMKGLSTQEIFKESKDLSLADNSNAMLLEYSEEYPTVLSNFGMGSRIINYYRRKDAEDQSRPKNEIGETSVLMPEDRSPFAQFGTIDPGETVPTLHNAMYRAPVFKQEAKSTDFLVIRTATGIGGVSWHLRNIDHVYVVGQQLPSMEIPGPQSRKVTNASKNRMKMIAFRKIRHSPNNTVRIDEITTHIADSSDMQNRQKLKEFIKYYKDEKVWRVKPGDIIPDEATVRSWVKPEDICVIDAMQVGLRHLEDAGYGRENADDGSDDEREGDSLEQQLAPWKTSKNFLDAATGKAMLQLHGEGDPSGCGMAFSFIKTSMKGGYLDTIQGPQATTEDAIARERKANGGHKYNVDKQNEIYTRAIMEIWDKQKRSLESQEEPDVGDEMDLDHPLEREDAAPPPSLPATSGNFDDSVSQISRFSGVSQKGSSGKAHRIVRVIKDKYGNREEVSEIVTDAKVWREYMKRRHALDADNQNVYDVKPTGDAEWDRKEAQRYVFMFATYHVYILLTHLLVYAKSSPVSNAIKSVAMPVRSRKASIKLQKVRWLVTMLALQALPQLLLTRHLRVRRGSVRTVDKLVISRRTRSCVLCLMAR